MNTATALEILVGKIQSDYEKHQTKNGQTPVTDHINERLNQFNESIEIIEGKKYIKITQGSSVWGFVVAVDNDKKFQQGDILKAAGYSTPARNHARGNIFDDSYSVLWTGPHYLR